MNSTNLKNTANKRTISASPLRVSSPQGRQLTTKTGLTNNSVKQDSVGHKLASPSSVSSLRRSTRIASTGSESVKSDESDAQVVPTSCPSVVSRPSDTATSNDVPTAPVVNQQNCLKLTIRVRRLNSCQNNGLSNQNTSKMSNNSNIYDSADDSI
ncbi:unnamed protein product, partial [Medioppia subpectinata]